MWRNSVTTSQHDFVASHYAPRAAAYVSSAVHASGADLDQIEAFVRGSADARALDLGCGGGHVSYRAAPHVREVVACDLTPDMLAEVKKTAATRGLANIVTQQAAAERLPFEAGAFDFVLSRYSAHHWNNFEAGLRDARRVLKDGAARSSPIASRPPIPCSTRICRRSNCCATPRMCAITARRNGWRRWPAPVFR